MVQAPQQGQANTSLLMEQEYVTGQLTREAALLRLASWARSTSPQATALAALEQSPYVWLNTLFSKWVSRPDQSAPGGFSPVDFAPHHTLFWDHIWGVRPGVKPKPFVGIWPRGGAKSTSVELACVALGARSIRRYVLYISATQEQADDHVQNIGALLENPTFSSYYPAVAQRLLGKYGSSKGWRRNRLRTGSGFTVDAIGLDTAARGVKLEEVRPDVLVFDDIDEELDGPAATDKKIIVLTRKLLPAGSSDSAVIAIQNLVIPDGIFSRLSGREGAQKADLLQDRIVSGPTPAVHDAVVVIPQEGPRKGKFTLVGGTPAWEGQDLNVCQRQIDEWGYSSWKVEAQQEVDAPLGGLFEHIDFDAIRVQPDEVPELIRSVVWVDPAVTSTDKSDSHGIHADGLGVDNKVYRLWSWEGRATPAQSLERAIRKALEINADHVGVETDQGGDVWEIAFQAVWDQLQTTDETLKAVQRPVFVAEKAGSGFGPKTHRASRMLVDYEQDRFRHVINPENTHQALERALKRFPIRKPYDLTDASFWSWQDLTQGTQVGIGASYDPAPIIAATPARTAWEAVQKAQGEVVKALRPRRLWEHHGARTLWRKDNV